jgi:hypothetical protein
VVNSFGQSHEIPNLYVAGPGIFATSGASNPTIRFSLFRYAAPNSWPQRGVRSPIEARNRARTRPIATQPAVTDRLRPGAAGCQQKRNRCVFGAPSPQYCCHYLSVYCSGFKRKGS